MAIKCAALWEEEGAMSTGERNLGRGRFLVPEEGRRRRRKGQGGNKEWAGGVN